VHQGAGARAGRAAHDLQLTSGIGNPGEDRPRASPRARTGLRARPVCVDRSVRRIIGAASARERPTRRRIRPSCLPTASRSRGVRAWSAHRGRSLGRRGVGLPLGSVVLDLWTLAPAPSGRDVRPLGRQARRAWRALVCPRFVARRRGPRRRLARAAAPRLRRRPQSEGGRRDLPGGRSQPATSAPAARGRQRGESPRTSVTLLRHVRQHAPLETPLRKARRDGTSFATRT
jgi:hypothetical protein